MASRWTRFGTLLAMALLASGVAEASDPFASDWAPSAKSRARLIADGAGGGAIEIELSPGAITYWRDPGEAGVPPTFDFSASENVANAEVAYPAPTRIAEADGSEAFGYREAAIFPVRVVATDPTRPAVLKLAANYAVCEKVCLPARANLSLQLPAQANSPFAGAIDAARAQVPKAVAGPIGDLTALDGRSWRFCAPGAPETSDLFLEGAAGYWLTAAPAPSGVGVACFTIALREAPDDAKPPYAVKATLTGSGGAKEGALSLEAKR